MSVDKDEPPPWEDPQAVHTYTVRFSLSEVRTHLTTRPSTHAPSVSGAVEGVELLVSLVGSDGETDWLQLGAVQPDFQNEIALEVGGSLGRLSTIVLGHTSTEGLGLYMTSTSVMDDKEGVHYEFETDFWLQATEEEFQAGTAPSVALVEPRIRKVHDGQPKTVQIKLQTESSSELSAKLKVFGVYCANKDLEIVHVSRNKNGNKADLYLRPKIAIKNKWGKVLGARSRHALDATSPAQISSAADVAGAGGDVKGPDTAMDGFPAPTGASVLATSRSSESAGSKRAGDVASRPVSRSESKPAPGAPASARSNGSVRSHHGGDSTQPLLVPLAHRSTSSVARDAVSSPPMTPQSQSQPRRTMSPSTQQSLMGSAKNAMPSRRGSMAGPAARRGSVSLVGSRRGSIGGSVKKALNAWGLPPEVCEETPLGQRDPPPEWNDPVLFTGYRVHFHLGQVTNPHQASTLVVTLVGEAGDSGWVELGDVAPLREDTIDVTTMEHLGSITSVVIGHTNTSGMGAMVESLDVLDATTGLKYTFESGTWLEAELNAEPPAEALLPLDEPEQAVEPSRAAKIHRVKIRTNTPNELTLRLRQMHNNCQQKGMDILQECVNQSKTCADIYVFVDRDKVKERIIAVAAGRYLWCTLLRTRARMAYAVISAFDSLVQVLVRNRVHTQYVNFVNINMRLLSKLEAWSCRSQYSRCVYAGYQLTGNVTALALRGRYLRFKRAVAKMTAYSCSYRPRADFVARLAAGKRIVPWVKVSVVRYRHSLRMLMSIHATVLQASMLRVIAFRRWQPHVIYLRQRYFAAYIIVDRSKAALYRSIYLNRRDAAAVANAWQRQGISRLQYCAITWARAQLQARLLRLVVRREKDLASVSLMWVMRRCFWRRLFCRLRLTQIVCAAQCRRALQRQRLMQNIVVGHEAAAVLQAALYRKFELLRFGTLIVRIRRQQRATAVLCYSAQRVLSRRRFVVAHCAVIVFQALCRRQMAASEQSWRTNAGVKISAAVRRQRARRHMDIIWAGRITLWCAMKRWATRRRMPPRVALAIGTALQRKRPRSAVRVLFDALDAGMLTLRVDAGSAERCDEKVSVLTDELASGGLECRRTSVHGDGSGEAFWTEVRIRWDGIADVPGIIASTSDPVAASAALDRHRRGPLAPVQPPLNRLRNNVATPNHELSPRSPRSHRGQHDVPLDDAGYSPSYLQTVNMNAQRTDVNTGSTSGSTNGAYNRGLPPPSSAERRQRAKYRTPAAPSTHQQPQAHHHKVSFDDEPIVQSAQIMPRHSESSWLLPAITPAKGSKAQYAIRQEGWSPAHDPSAKKVGVSGGGGGSQATFSNMARQQAREMDGDGVKTSKATRRNGGRLGLMPAHGRVSAARKKFDQEMAS